MTQAKRVSKGKRSANAVKLLGIAGASLAASTSGSAALMMDATPFEVANPDEAYTLNDEEISDVSLATFHFFDKEALGTLSSGVQLARGCGCGRGCGGCRGCGGRGCGGRGCGRGCGWGGCRGCGGGWGWYGCGVGGCCLSWGGCYYC